MTEEEIKKEWNRFVNALIVAKKAWEKLSEELSTSDVSGFLTIEARVVKMISVYRKAKFDVMLPRFIDFYRGQGGIEEMLATIEKPKAKGKKEED